MIIVLLFIITVIVKYKRHKIYLVVWLKQTANILLIANILLLKIYLFFNLIIMMITT